jgi:muramoyltetrapeptide carboxypeptidase
MHRVKVPPKLITGQEIRIISPASVVEEEYVINAANALTELDYKATYGKHVFSAENQFAGRDSFRLADFQEALDDEKVKAIICARGGYGSIRIASGIHFKKFRKNPKWIAGFSDITVFHSLLNCHFHIASIHSPMPVNFSSPDYRTNLKELDNILKGKAEAIIVSPDPLNRLGTAEANLVGGNLSILINLQSTAFEIETDNAILFIEDVGEQLYHLDRMMQNLLLSGKLSKLKGLVVGALTDMSDKKIAFGKSPNEIVYDAVKDFGYPVAFNYPGGHISDNRPFVLGNRATLEVTASGSKLITHS